MHSQMPRQSIDLDAEDEAAGARSDPHVTPDGLALGPATPGPPDAESDADTSAGESDSEVIELELDAGEDLEVPEELEAADACGDDAGAWPARSTAAGMAAGSSGDVAQTLPMRDDAEMPLLEQWEWTRDGALTGRVFGRKGFRQGELMTTSTVVEFSPEVVEGSKAEMKIDSAQLNADEEQNDVEKQNEADRPDADDEQNAVPRLRHFRIVPPGGIYLASVGEGCLVATQSGSVYRLGAPLEPRSPAGGARGGGGGVAQPVALGDGEGAEIGRGVGGGGGAGGGGRGGGGRGTPHVGRVHSRSSGYSRNGGHSGIGGSTGIGSLAHGGGGSGGDGLNALGADMRRRSRRARENESPLDYFGNGSLVLVPGTEAVSRMETGGGQGTEGAVAGAGRGGGARAGRPDTGGGGRGLEDTGGGDVEALFVSVGGAGNGGAAAERILRASFSVLDDNCVYLRAQYSGARRVVLWRGGLAAQGVGGEAAAVGLARPVAACVVETHVGQMGSAAAAGGQVSLAHA